MKTNIFSILSCLIMLSLQIFSQNQNFNLPTIEVFGTAEIKVNPDIMLSEIDVQTENNNVVYAKNENDKIVLNVTDVLKHYGITDNDIQTSGIRIYKNTSYSENSKLYSVSNNISYKLNDLSKYYELTSELVKIEHIFITYSNYDYSKIIETRKQARENALIAAKDKAEEMARVLGQFIGKPVFVSEEPVYDYYATPQNVSTQNGNVEGSYGVLKEGTINVTAKVKIVFELLNK